MHRVVFSLEEIPFKAHRLFKSFLGLPDGRDSRGGVFPFLFSDLFHLIYSMVAIMKMIEQHLVGEGKNILMENTVPPVVSLRILRRLERCSARCVGVSPAPDTDVDHIVKQIAASFKTFGCVCIPVSDLDVREVRDSFFSMSNHPVAF